MITKVVDQVPDADELERYRELLPDKIKHIVLHRSGPWPKRFGRSAPKDMRDLQDWYVEIPETGYKQPYHYLWTPDAVYQGLPVDKQGAHAGGYNHESIAVALAGDWRKRTMTVEQFAFASGFIRWLKVSMYYRLGRALSIVGHTDLKGASGDPNKVCPGDGAFVSLLGKGSEFTGTMYL